MIERRNSESNLPVWVVFMGMAFGLPLILILGLFVLVIPVGLAVGAVALPMVMAGRSVYRRVATATAAPAERATLVRTIELPASASALEPVIGKTRPLFEPVDGKVAVTVTSARGTCPNGQAFRVGERYVFTNGHVVPGLCPVAERAIRPLVEQMRRGEYPAVIRPYCVTRTHEVVFELEGVPAETREPQTA